MDKAEVFRSKVDAWLLLVLFGVPTALIAITAVVGADNPQLIVLVLLFSLIPEGLVVWLLVATHYTVDGKTLRIRSGPFRWDVDIAGITSIKPTRNPLSSPALSLDRLEILYGHGRSIMISPADKERFLAVIEKQRGPKPPVW